MQDHAFLQNAVIFLLAAVVAVPLFKRWGLGAVLAYLAAGALIGPDGFALVANSEAVVRLSEFGVVMLLFVIGLELSPARIWVMRRAVFGLGSLQVALTALAIGLLALAFGLAWKTALVVGFGLALSSTAIGLQLLAERKELASPHGRLGFAVLLFQDVAALPLLALIPVLGASGASGGAAPDALAAIKVVGVLVAVIIGGRYLLRPLFRIVARAQSVEVFTATALLVVVGTAWLMELAGMSMALGAFIAGALLADSEYRHELESHIEPFKGLLLGLFFISVGMSVDIDLVRNQPWLIAGLVIALLLLKAAVLAAIGRSVGRLDNAQAISLAALLAQGGEFAFVVFNVAGGAGLLDAALRDLLIVVITLSMAATPLLVIGAERARAALPSRARPEFDAIEDQYPRVIIAGFGRIGQIVARVLRAQHIAFTALENSPEQVEVSRRFGNTIYYGDPSRPELLRAARADRAELFVLATDDPEANVRTARLLKRHFPHLKIMARARNRQHAFRLMDLGVDIIVRETLHSSLELSRQVLIGLGLDAQMAVERVETFRRHDDELLKAQHLVYDDEAALVQSSRDALRELESLFEADRR